MPKGTYKRKKKSGGDLQAVTKRQRRGGYTTLLDKLRAKRDKLSDEIVALGNAIDALEVLE